MGVTMADVNDSFPIWRRGTGTRRRESCGFWWAIPRKFSARRYSGGPRRAAETHANRLRGGLCLDEVGSGGPHTTLALREEGGVSNRSDGVILCDPSANRIGTPEADQRFSCGPGFEKTLVGAAIGSAIIDGNSPGGSRLSRPPAKTKGPDLEGSGLPF